MREIQRLMRRTQHKATFFNCSHTPTAISDKKRHLSTRFQKQLICSRSQEKESTQHKKSLFRLKFTRSEGKYTVTWANRSMLFPTSNWPKSHLPRQIQSHLDGMRC